jgi:hypothetical protein
VTEESPERENEVTRISLTAKTPIGERAQGKALLLKSTIMQGFALLIAYRRESARQALLDKSTITQGFAPHPTKEGSSLFGNSTTGRSVAYTKIKKRRKTDYAKDIERRRERGEEQIKKRILVRLPTGS